MAVFAFCAAVCAFVFWSTETPWGKRIYRIIPSIILIYYLPTLASNLGVIPTSSPAYDWMRDYLLPCSLFILMVATDVPTILGIGPKAIGVMLAGTLGVIIGGPIAFLLCKSFLEPDAWKGLAALSGSWIGGGANFAAIKESVGAPDSIIGPIIIVDTAVGYTWMGILMVLANYRSRVDRWLRADARILDELSVRLAAFEKKESRPARLPDVSMVLALGFVGAVVCTNLAHWWYARSSAWMEQSMPSVAAIFTPFTWLVIFISTIGILLSFTRFRRLESRGASKLGYAGLYLFLTSIGAKADLAGILSAPLLLLVGAIWILIHVAVILAVARWLRAPLFLVAVGSQANIGGAASAPVLAAAYYPSMAPVGLLMGVLGYLVGNYAGLLCAFLLQLASG